MHFFPFCLACYDGNLRIDETISGINDDGYQQYGGRVKVCQNRKFGSICGTGWDQNGAQVVCRYMGYYEDEYSK